MELGPSPLRTVRRFAELDSTNRWAASSSPEFTDEQLPLLVVAERQTSGRGRSGRSWHADAGTLTFSWLDSVSRLRLVRSAVPQVALVAGLSVAEAIEALIPPLGTRIKWPNDVYVAGGKVAGILVETAGATADRIVIGIGVNVATDLAQAPDEVRQRAASLTAVSGRPLRSADLMETIVDRLAENLATLAVDFRSLADSIRRRCLLTGQRVTLQRGSEALVGLCRGMDDSGALQIDDGPTSHCIQSGEIVRFA